MISSEIKESFLMAMSAIASHKLRSALTLVGILVGVFSIIVVMTAMRVMQNTIESELSELGAHTFRIQKWPAIQFHGGRDRDKYIRRKSMTYQTCLDLKNRATLPAAIGAEEWLWQGPARSRFAETNPNVELRGVTPETFAAKNWVLSEGRGLLEADVANAGYVCVLGADLAKKLFPHNSPVGDTVKFEGVSYRVLGVLEGKGAIFGQSQDNFMAIPITTGLNRYNREIDGDERNIDILVQATGAATFDDTVEQVRGVLRMLRKVPPGEEDDFEIVSNDTLINQFRSVTLALRAGVAVISSIALIAAGIGIMNIMLVSVTERTREIGIRRAIGARKRNIMFQFVLEAVALCQIGGLLGVIAGIAGGNIAALLFKLPPVLPIDWSIYGLLICSGVGILFGTYPAFKAANLDPIESLRYE